MVESLTLSQQKHLDILEAAKAAFLECGFDNVSMDAIADRAAVSKRTVYNHFESKGVLFEAITGQLIERFKGGLRVDYDSAVPLNGQLRHIAEVRVELLTDKKLIDTIRMLLAGMLTAPESCREAMMQSPEKEDPFIEWVQAARDDGRLIDCDPRMTAHLFRSMMDGMFFWPSVIGHHDVPSDDERDTVLDSVVSIFLNTYAIAETDQK